MRERGLKSKYFVIAPNGLMVAPVRERGLKSALLQGMEVMGKGRSREGAWIEIKALLSLSYATFGRSREGAWIEIMVLRYATIL